MMNVTLSIWTTKDITELFQRAKILPDRHVLPGFARAPSRISPSDYGSHFDKSPDETVSDFIARIKNRIFVGEIAQLRDSEVIVNSMISIYPSSEGHHIDLSSLSMLLTCGISIDVAGSKDSRKQ